MIRRTTLLLFVISLLFSPFDLLAQTSITFTDVSGQTITLDKPAEKIVLGEGRSLLALSLIDEKPVDRIAGWMGDFHFLGDELYNQYKNKFPNIDNISLVGRTGEETFSVEKTLTLQPDVVIFGINGHGPGLDSHDVLRQLRAAGIPIVFVDFRQQPFAHTLPSIRVLGKVIGREEKAEEYIQFYQSHMDRISTRLSQAKTLNRPSVLLELHAGAFGNCCPSPGKESLGKFIEFAGGENIGADVIPGALGTLSLEYILSQNPDIYIGTGVEPSIRDKGIAIGTDVDPATTRATLKKILQRTGFNALSAVQENQIYALWHNFYNSPVNILAVEAMAKWFHPTLFEDLDPSQTLKELNNNFLAVPMEGTYWLSPE